MSQSGTSQELPVGVPQHNVPAGSTTTQYAWLQTWGPALVQGDGSTFVDGALVVPATAATGDAGQVTLGVEQGTGTTTTLIPVGKIIEASDAASDLDFRLVDLTIRP